jgi:DNA mismatch endonuclease (patch repair protein)
MADVFTKAKRSAVMSRIRGRGNKDTEIALARLLRQNKITGWRRHLPIFGRPDFAFPKQKIAVFVDGCFWHGCPEHSSLPVNNRAFWKRKFSTNKLRDILVKRTLRSQGWRVLRIWEHDLARKQISRLPSLILRALGKNSKITSQVFESNYQSRDGLVRLQNQKD